MGGPSKPEIDLIPWDPDSPKHVERLLQQRIACGWNQERILESQELQRLGTNSLQWVILPDSDVNKAANSVKHIKAWPEEKLPLSDTAALFGGKPRIPSPRTAFVPVGHISLNTIPDEPGSYKVSTFYISWPLQRNGLGSAAMDTL